MARLTPSSTRTTGYNGSSLPPRTGGGGDGRSGRDGGDSKPDSMPNYGERLRRARLGLAVAMTPILMLFISFTAAYLVRRGFLTFDLSSDTYVRTWLPVQLPWPWLLANTAVLILSSITIECARRDITRQSALAPVQSIPGISLGDERHFPWLGLTTVLGLVFLSGQLWIWSVLASRGFHLNTGPSSSFVYFLTGMHAIHLAGGGLALLFADLATLLHRPIESRRIVVDITAWYWHFMTGLWIYILVLFSFAAQ
jgi:cytochrome c oxidase subunit III